MDSTPHGWTVIDRDEAILVREYAFNEKGRANGFVARLPDGKLLVVSPPRGLDEGAFADLEAFGHVGAVLANNGFHHLGQQEWRARFPTARFFAAPEAQARIAKKAPGVGPFEPLEALTPLLGDRLGLTASPGTKAGESWVWAEGAGGHVWYGSDVFCNWDRFPGNFLLNALWRWAGSRPGLSLFHLAMMATTKDKPALLRRLLEDLEAHPPSVAVPAHGPIAARPGLAEETRTLVAAAL